MSIDDATSRPVPPGNHLTRRDLLVLRDLWLLRYLTAAQISRLYFGHLKLAQRRLRRLTEMRAVTRFRPSSARAFGDQRWIYRLSHHGASLVAAAENPDLRLRIPSRSPSATAYFAHHELLTNFRIWLREGCAAVPEISCRFVPAYEEVSFKGTRRRRVTIELDGAGEAYVPDGVFTLDHEGGQSALFILEVDRATEPLTRRSGSSITAKLRLFRRAFDEGLSRYRDLFDHPFIGARLLWVVPDRARMEAILDLAEHQEDLPHVVWATTHTIIESTGDLRLLAWRAAARPEPTSLLE